MSKRGAPGPALVSNKRERREPTVRKRGRSFSHGEQPPRPARRACGPDQYPYHDVNRALGQMHAQRQAFVVPMDEREDVYNVDMTDLDEATRPALNDVLQQLAAERRRRGRPAETL